MKLTPEQKQFKKKLEAYRKREYYYSKKQVELKKNCPHAIDWIFTNRSPGYCVLCGCVFGSDHPDYEKALNEKINNDIENYDFKNVTINSLLELCTEVRTKEQVEKIMEKYRAVEEHANHNLGYIFGYCNEETRKKLYSLFSVNHPMFGSNFGRGKE